ncbi:MAG: hypothetical protein PHD51_00170 [Patescibacteria group bacterium]|nr:hypothetical protein [Patescibacteria group bacterium]MDD5490716.1 hypothetical protein [Patescibacteria group bacterium]
MKIPEQYKSLEYVHDIEWRDIFAVWRVYEAYQKGWEKHWRERGFNSWDEWRANYVAPLKPQEKKWKIYRINDIAEVEKFYGTPTRSWIAKCYGGIITKRLSDIINHPLIAANNKIKDIINNFPFQTMLTGVIHNGEIVLIEGIHRAGALALMAREGKRSGGEVVIALAEHDSELLPLGKGDS